MALCVIKKEKSFEKYKPRPQKGATLSMLSWHINKNLRKKSKENLNLSRRGWRQNYSMSIARKRGRGELLDILCENNVNVECTVHSFEYLK